MDLEKGSQMIGRGPRPIVASTVATVHIFPKMCLGARAQRAARQSASAAHELWPFVSVHLHKHLGNADALQESLCDLVIDQIG